MRENYITRVKKGVHYFDVWTVVILLIGVLLFRLLGIGSILFSLIILLIHFVKRKYEKKDCLIVTDKVLKYPKGIVFLKDIESVQELESVESDEEFIRVFCKKGIKYDIDVSQFEDRKEIIINAILYRL